MGSHALLQRIFPTQGSNPGTPHCRWILYQPSQAGSPLSTQIAMSSILTLETLHKKPHWRRCPFFWSCAHCRRHPPPQSHPGFEGNFGCSWDVVKSCDPGQGPPEEHGITEWRAGSPRPHRSFVGDWGKWVCAIDLGFLWGEHQTAILTVFNFMYWQMFQIDFNDQQEVANFLSGQERTVKIQKSKEKSKWRNMFSPFHKSEHMG